jgi:4-amino-4-deoxy-L-arabinose transferase-like glycosyltransferase
MSSRHQKFFWLILLLYLALGLAYALLTPLWQAPDEPAHFNNIVAIATTGHLPELRPGDYDQAYLEALKAAHFPPELSIAPVRYEAHQPPLYYALMTPLYRVTASLGQQNQARALRLFNLLIGLEIISFIWLAGHRLFPHRPRVALLAAGAVAFLPMHIAMTASINNDALAELFIAAVMLRLLRALRMPQRWPSWALTGFFIGLGLLTKFQAYILIPLAGVVWLWQLKGGWRQAKTWFTGVALALPALLLGVPWWLRNLKLYGGFDLFGLERHNVVVVGQPRTAHWIATQGWSAYLERFFTFTFRSFWGVFGWMGVFMDDRAYLFLTLLSVLVLTGVLYQLWRWQQKQIHLTPAQKRGLILLMLQLVLVLAAYLWYNLDFVQHQGRYLFPALLPLSLLAAAGLLGMFSHRGSRVAAYVALLMLLAWALAGLRVHDVNGWALLLAGASALALAVRALTRAGRALWWGLATEALVALLALYALVGAIIPQLAR